MKLTENPEIVHPKHPAAFGRSCQRIKSCFETTTTSKTTSTIRIQRPRIS